MTERPKHPKALPEFEPAKPVRATLHTSLGDIECTLFAEDCPVTVGNFVGLAENTIEWKAPGKANDRPLYDNTLFHRIIPDFMVQAGDPLGTGMGGPGYRFGDEFVDRRKHDKPGMLSMANAGPGTNGSQFFITHAATPWLDGRHTVFGEVTKGMDVVEKMVAVPRDGSDRPKEDVVLKTVKIER